MRVRNEEEGGYLGASEVGRYRLRAKRAGVHHRVGASHLTIDRMTIEGREHRRRLAWRMATASSTGTRTCTSVDVDVDDAVRKAL